MDHWSGHLILIVAGTVAGALNVVAGGGSFLTLPVLIFLGLPAGVANGTNRVGILSQNIGAVWSFDRHGVLEWRFLTRAALPATLGAGLGTWGALRISDDALQQILALLMVAVTLWTLWDPFHAGADGSTPGRSRRLMVPPMFFLVGMYGGFIQAGVGFFLLAGTTLAGLNLVRGNAVKVLCALSFTIMSLSLFAWHGKVSWPAGLSLGIGTFLGGLIGVRLTVLKGHAWLRGVVTITVILFAIRLWWWG